MAALVQHNWPRENLTLEVRKVLLTKSIKARQSAFRSSKRIVVEAMVGETVHSATDWCVAQIGHCRPGATRAAGQGKSGGVK